MKKPDSVRMPEIKVRAKRLTTALKNTLNISIQHTKVLDLISQEDGYKNWNTYRAILNHETDTTLTTLKKEELIHIQQVQVTTNHVFNYLSWFKTGIEMCIPASSTQSAMKYTVFGINEDGQEFALTSDNTVSIQHNHPVQEQLQSSDTPPIKVVFYSSTRAYTATEAFRTAELWKIRNPNKRPLLIMNSADYALHRIATMMDAFDNFTKSGCARAVIEGKLTLTEEALLQGDFGELNLLKTKLALLIKEDSELEDLVSTASISDDFSDDNLKKSPAFS